MVKQYLYTFMNFYQDNQVDWLPLAKFAANNTISKTTGVLLFFANYGFYLRLGTELSQPYPLDLSILKRWEFYKANIVVDRFKRIITQLKALAAQVVRKYKEDANKLREDSLWYTKEQKVWINTRNIKTNRPIKKEDDKQDSPFLILKAYK